nr:uncharacterized protein LOC109150412 [Ipomoea batatas]
MHIGGDLVFTPRFSYTNGTVEYFDHFNYDEVESEDNSSVSVGVDVEGPDGLGKQNEEFVDVERPYGLGKQNEEFVEVECNLSKQVLRSLCDSDSDGGVNGPVNVFEEGNMKKEGFKFVAGMIFNSSKEFKYTTSPVHSCGNQDENKVVTFGFLAKFFKDELE